MATTDETVQIIRTKQGKLEIDIADIRSEFNGKPNGLRRTVEKLATTVDQLMQGQQGARDTADEVKAALEETTA
jgi:hypothetical protein